MAARGNSFVRWITSRSTRRALVALIVFVVLWEIGSRSKQWFGIEMPWIGKIPPPSQVLVRVVGPARRQGLLAELGT